MADDAEPTTPTSSNANEEELKKARIRAAKLKAKSKVTKPKAEATTTTSTETGDKAAPAAVKKDFDLKGKKRFEVKKWNAVALWAWGTNTEKRK